MSDVKADQYPDQLGILTLNIGGSADTTWAIGSFFTLFIATKDTWLDDVKYVVNEATGIAANTVLTLYMAPSGTELGLGTALAVTPALDVAAIGAPTSMTPSHSSGTFSGYRIPAGYHVGFVSSVGAIGGAAASIHFTARLRTRAQ